MSDQNFGKIDVHQLPWLPLTVKTDFPKHPAVYLVIDKQDNIFYVGRSTNPKRRWNAHHKQEAIQKFGDVRVAFLFVDDPKDLVNAEAAMINRLHPCLNDKKVAFTDYKTRQITLTLSPGCLYDFKCVARSKGITLQDYIVKVLDDYQDSEEFDSLMGRVQEAKLNQMWDKLSEEQQSMVRKKIKELIFS